MRTTTTAFVTALLLAQPVAAATYDALDYDGIRGIWTDGLVLDRQDRARQGKFKLWSISDGSFEVDDATGDAVLSGAASNVGAAEIFGDDIGFEFELRLERVARDGNQGYCQYGGWPSYACTDGRTKDGVAYAPLTEAELDDWSFYAISSGTFTGTGEMTGLTFDITDTSDGVHPPQFGEGANALEPDDLGFSAWFRWEATGTETSEMYNFAQAPMGTKHGDFNIDVAVAPVPVPAALPLLLAGAGALMAVGRRRRR